MRLNISPKKKGNQDRYSVGQVLTMTCEDADEPPRLAIRGAERCTNIKAEMKGVGRRWIAVRIGNALNLDGVSSLVVVLSPSICVVDELRTWDDCITNKIA